MKFSIKHDISGRIRIHTGKRQLAYKEADSLEYYLKKQNFVTEVKVYHRTADAVIYYAGEKKELFRVLGEFDFEKTFIPAAAIGNSSREMTDDFQKKLVNKVLFRYGAKMFVPYPVRAVYIGAKSLKYITLGVKTLMKGKIEVPVLDAAAIGVSVLRKDMNTAGSVMFLLGIGELLEEWTHKKSVDDLARSMSLNTGNVWTVRDGKEVLVPAGSIREGELVVVHMGNVVPFDGNVESGEAMVNQASLTGESAPVRKVKDSYAYAGTVVEEGEITVKVKELSGSSRFEKIVTMIEESERLKSNLEGKASHLADKLVPYTLAGTALTYALTRSTTKALSILMVDFSCALKLAMPIAVLSAIREARGYDINVKGGKFLEAVAEADTIVFDKTGTLTKARPVVVDVVSFNGDEPDKLLGIAACLEEHFPHSMAKAVVTAAKEKGIEHEEMHSKVQYIVAHGISTEIDGKKAVIGSHHFVFEDEKAVIPRGKKSLFKNLSEDRTHLYLAIENKLAAVICIEDPLREEASAVINSLRKAGIKHMVMMTGDSEKTAAAIAAKVGVDEYYSEVLPEDKAAYIEKVRAEGRKVIMIGDGINDSPALSAADAGIAISDGAEIAREIADITIGADNLFEIVTLRLISDGLMKRINKNYRFIVGFNSMLLALGIGGVLQPATSAMLHNTSTLMVSVKSMQNLLS